ncbi:30S ribosomal protein [Dirofilaria immitis]
MNQPEGVSFKRCENNKQSKSDEEESLDTFPADLKIRRLDVLQRSRERRRQQMENGYLFLKPTDSAHLTTKVLSAYQNGLIEGHWRERCVNYEKQIKALSANLRVADHEIRRLAGLEMSESMIKSRKQKFPHATYPIGMNYLPAANASSDRSFSICSEQFKSCQNSKNARILIIDNANYASNSSTENVNLSERPTNAQNIHMPSESRIDEGNETFMCEVSALKSRTIFGTSVIQNPSNEIKDDGKDDGQISGSYHDSDSFNSDEEDSEEERLYNEKVAELQRRH